MVGGTGGRDELKCHQLTHNQLMSPQGPQFCPHSTAKTNDKSTNFASIGISDVVTASSRLEPQGLLRTDGKRPDGVTITFGVLVDLWCGMQHAQTPFLSLTESRPQVEQGK